MRYITTHPFLISEILYGFQELYTVGRHCQLSVQRYSFFCIFICQQFCEIALQFTITGSKLRITGVDRNENTFIICTAFKDQLMICDDNISVRTIAESVTVSADFNQVFDEISQFIRLRLFEAWAKSIIIIRCFHTFLAPFTSVIDTRNTRHTKEKTVSKRKMILIRQDTCDTCDIMIIYECH